ncbi:tripartite tricarboxylate transporter substrate binding protein [Bordetella petrii]|uniref:tripartite tricarboxylate transporter substrate binding protein n=1 Tax=Bordetella petrii TaxID=94624 RepID=UPI001E385C1A|nr:tripartite tricarboxylate transporter substrate binding protein [Bordetella petrii]MCD0502659.1 tripartite tricarboxylate transporter substrate binding protein [Bordetella petrii]
MFTRSVSLRVALGLATTLVLFTGSAARAAADGASAYPQRPITLVTPYPPGASTDALARIVAKTAGEKLGQAIVVESKAGAGGTIAAQYTARAKPDGYTFMLTAGGIMTINPSVYKQLPYDPQKDFTSLTVAVRVPLVVAVRSDSPFKTMNDITAQARKTPGKLTYGSAGIGTSQHLAGELYKNMADVEILHVPYKGGAPAMNDLLGGQIDMMFVQIPSAEAQVRNGALRLLSIGSPQRSKALPNVPTLAESGLPGYDSNTWYGFNMPAHVPPAIAAKLHDAIIQALDENEDKLEALGFVKEASTQAEMDQTVRDETRKWAPVIRAAGFFGTQ